MGDAKFADKSDWHGLVKELAAGVSTQAQVANRVWLALITVGLVAVLPRTPANSNLALPLGLGDVDRAFFYPIAFSILVVLAIAFAAAHAQAIRAGLQAQRAISSLPGGSPADAHVRPRDMFDMWRIPSLNRVGPLAQLAIDQLSSDAVNRTAWARATGVAYYVMLKLLSILVYYGLPALALGRVYANVPRSGWAGVLLAVGGIVASLALFHVFVSDLWYTRKVVARLWRGPEGSA